MRAFRVAGWASGGFVRRGVIAAALLTMLVSACVARLPDKGRVEVGPGEPLRIGVMTQLDGPVAADGRAVLNAVTLAVEQHGAVRGHPVTIVPAGGGCDSAAAGAAAADLAGTAGLAGIVGPICSAACVEAETALGETGVAIVTPRCTDISVTRQGYEGVFRTSWTDALEIAGVAKFVDDNLHGPRVFFVDDGTVYGRSVRDIFTMFYGKSRLAGTDDAGNTAEVRPGTGDYSPLVRAIAKSSAGLVYYAGFADDAARFVSQLRAGGVTLPVMAPEAVKEGGFAATAGPVAEGVYLTNAMPERGSSYDQFVVAYRSRFGTEPGAFAGQAYDAARVLLHAVYRTVETHGGRLTIDRRALLGAIGDTDLKGVTGRIAFHENGDRVGGANVRVLRVHDGALVEQAVIEPED